MKIRFLVLIAALFIIPFGADAATLNLFYGKECPHCEAEQQYLKELKKEMGDDLVINKYEVWHDEENSALLDEVKEALGDTESSGVPYTVIGNETILGFNETTTKAEIEKLLKKKSADVDVVQYVIDGQEIPDDLEEEASSEYTVPVLGDINAKDVSLPLLAAILGLIDGFNPCAMWVLLFLITMLIQMKDKKRMVSLGLSFIITSGIVYTAFMVAWLNLATTAMQQVILRAVIAAIALIAGFINLRSYIKSRNNPDGCEVVSDKKRTKILEKIKKFTKEQSFVLALIGVVTLAATVNLVELACSAGLPLLFTSILALNDLNTIAYAFNIFIYILFFLLDDIIVFLIAVKTSEVTGLSTKYSKYTHLVGGIIMVLIGLLLIFKPAWIMLNF